MKYVIAFLALGLLFSCGKAEDKEKPNIEILKPTGIDTFSVGVDSLPIVFKLSDNTGLSQYSYVLKDSLDEKYEVGGKFIDGMNYEHKSFAKFGGFGGVLKLWLYVTVYDKAYNTRVISKIFYVQP